MADEAQTTDNQASEAPAQENQEQEINTSEDTNQSEQAEQTETDGEANAPASDETDGEQEGDESDAEGQDQDDKQNVVQDNERNREAESQRKQRNAEQARARIAARQRSDPYIQELKQTADAQVQNIENEYERRIAAMEYREQINNINQVRNTLVAENNEVRSQIDVFNPSSDKYVGDEDYQDLIAEFDKSHTVKDQDGNIYDANDSLYDFMQRQANRIERYTSNGQRTGQRAERKLQSTAITPPATNNQSGSDSLEERVANIKF